jgi:hypothetical protein
MGADSTLVENVLAGSANTIGTNESIVGRAIAQTAVTCETACTIETSGRHSASPSAVPSAAPSISPSPVPSAGPSSAPISAPIAAPCTATTAPVPNQDILYDDLFNQDDACGGSDLFNNPYGGDTNPGLKQMLPNSIRRPMSRTCLPVAAAPSKKVRISRTLTK